MFKKGLIIFLFLMWFSPHGNTQVYNYETISYNNIETNPAVLTSDKKNNRFKFVQQNSLSKSQPFSYTRATYSTHLNSNFFGAGLTLNNTYAGEGNSYRYAGMSIGYRNVVLSKTLLKLGATYKTIFSSKGGVFGYYDRKEVQSNRESKLKDQLNLSISVTGDAELYYLTLSTLNLDLPWNTPNQNSKFSRYYLVNLGNLGALVDAIPLNEISYDGMSRYDIEEDKWKLSHYLNLRYLVPISRKMMAFLGLRSGYLESSYFHFRPSVTLFRERWSFNAMYSFHLNDSNLNVSKTSTIQTSIFFKL